jgi:hypothetical protein
VPRSLQQWDQAILWCEENIGVLGEIWTHTGAEMQISDGWWFKNAQDAMMFRMVWC